MVAGKMILRGAALPRLMLVGMVGNSVATATLALISADSAVIVTAVMMLSGFTLGLALPTGLVIVQGTVPKTQMGVATATAALSRTLGGAMGVALLTAILFASLGLGGSGGAEALREALASGEQREALASSFRLTLFVISFTSAMGALIALAMPRHAGR
jgi:hypothetical protein